MLVTLPNPDIDNIVDEQNKSSSSSAPNAPNNKVELDLDDAPFLQNPSKSQRTLADKPTKEKEQKTVKKESTPLSSNKWFFVSLVLFLLLLGGGSWFILTKQPAPPSPASTPTPKLPKGVHELIVAMEPFLIEQKRGDKTRFLQCKFSLPTKNAEVAAEIRLKIIILRDAMHSYLKNKEPTFLADEKNVETLKKDLLEVINKYLSSGQIKDILVEEYVVR